MAEILVRGQTSGWLTFGRVMAVLAVVVGLVLGLLMGEAAWLVPVIGLILTIGLEIRAARQRLRRRWVVDLGNGLRIRDRQGERVLPDHDVVVIGHELENVYSNGVLSAVRRKCTLWPVTGGAPVEFDYQWPTQSGDPLGGAIERIFHSVAERLRQLLDEGETIVGEGWRLNRQELVVKQKRGELVVPAAEIVACQEFDKKMSLWRKGQDEACASVPRGGSNTCLLPVLLAEQVDAAAARADDTGGLGRILFERRARPEVRVLLWMGGGVLAFIGLILAVAPGAMDQRVGGACMLAFGGLLLACAWGLRYSLFRCQERGVFQTDLFSKKQLRYVDVESFSFGATRHYHNGAYVGTALSLRFTPRAGATLPTIKFSTTVKGDDSSLNELRDFISRDIGSRMADALATGQPVVWTQRLQFQPEGLLYFPSTLFGKKPAEFLPLAEYGGYQLHEGTLSIFRRGNPKPVVTESSSSPNFYPGFYLLLSWLHGGEESA